MQNALGISIVDCVSHFQSSEFVKGLSDSWSRRRSGENYAAKRWQFGNAGYICFGWQHAPLIIASLFVRRYSCCKTLDNRIRLTAKIPFQYRKMSVCVCVCIRAPLYVTHYPSNWNQNKQKINKLKWKEKRCNALTTERWTMHKTENTRAMQIAEHQYSAQAKNVDIFGDKWRSFNLLPNDVRF